MKTCPRCKGSGVLNADAKGHGHCELCGTTGQLRDDVADYIAALEAELAAERELKDAARQRWAECQQRLAHIESVGIELTGQQTDPESNLRILREMVNQAEAELAAERTKRQEAEGFVSDVKDCAAELFEALRDHWKVDADAMTLYLLSLSAGFAKAWAENPPKNGVTHSAKFAGVGKVQIDVRRIDGKSAAESLRDAEAENAALRERVRVLSEALRSVEWGVEESVEDHVTHHETPTYYCPACWQLQSEGHLSDCAVGAALAASPEPPADARRQHLRENAETVATWPEWMSKGARGERMEPPASADATEGE